MVGARVMAPFVVRVMVGARVMATFIYSDMGPCVLFKLKVDVTELILAEWTDVANYQFGIGIWSFEIRICG